MENLSNLDEIDDLGHHPSPSSSMDQNDQPTPVTTGYSTMSSDSSRYCRTSSEASAFSDPTDDSSSYSEGPSPLCWPSVTPAVFCQIITMKQHSLVVEDQKPTEENPQGVDIELEMMKERFSKLLLGEDMSGSGKGVCTAVTISNSMTNLYATVFGQNLRLEPLSPEKKLMWKREMDCLLSVCDYIVEFIPKTQSLPDGTVFEIMSSRPRSDIHINLPALQKLDAMLQDILDSFQDPEFCYAEQGNLQQGSSRFGSFRRVSQRTDERWWLPVPCVPGGGLSKESRKHLQHKRDCANQIHKAAMAINSSILAEIEIPETYIESLPKSGRASLGDSIYRYMCTADKFCPDHLLNCLSIESEHEALELADRVEASMYTWRRKACLKHSKSSWNTVKDLVSDADRSDKNHILAERAGSLLFCLKQRYPGLSQTSLDTCKIEHNRDVGQAVLESYSRVLEGMAFNIVAWIEDVLQVDRSAKAHNRSN